MKNLPLFSWSALSLLLTLPLGAACSFDATGNDESTTSSSSSTSDTEDPPPDPGDPDCNKSYDMCVEQGGNPAYCGPKDKPECHVIPTTGSSEPSCPDGQDGCPCYGNQTCDAGLSCEQNTCQPSEPIPTTSATDTDGGSATDGASGSDTATDDSGDTTGEPPCMPTVCTDFLDPELCADADDKPLTGIQFLEIVFGSFSSQLAPSLNCFQLYTAQYPQLAQEFFFLGLLKGDGFDYHYTTFPADQLICYQEAEQIYQAASVYQAPPLTAVVKVGQKDDPIKFVPINSQVSPITTYNICGPTAQDPLTQVTVINDTLGVFGQVNNTQALNLVALQWVDPQSNLLKKSMYLPLQNGAVTFNGLDIHGLGNGEKVEVSIVGITSGVKNQAFRLGFFLDPSVMRPGGQHPNYQTQ